MNRISVPNVSLRGISLKGISFSDTDAPSGPPVVFYDRLVGDGVAYIDTGLKPKKTDSYIIDFFRGNAANIDPFGCTSDNYWHFFQIRTQNGGHLYVAAFRWDGDTTSANGINPILAKRFKFKLTPTLIYGQNITDGLSAEYTKAYGNQTACASLPIHLFGVNNNGANYHNGVQSIYEFSAINSDGDYYAHLVPCTYMGEPGMYDTVNNVFYGNANTEGSFTVAND